MVGVQSNLGRTMNAIGGRSSGHDELCSKSSSTLCFTLGEEILSRFYRNYRRVVLWTYQ
jgi:hypothetical protein